MAQVQAKQRRDMLATAFRHKLHLVPALVLVIMVALLSVSVISAVTSRELTAGNGVADDQFGHAVSIAGDYLVVGSKKSDYIGAENTYEGRAYVYEWTGSLWDELEITPTDPQVEEDARYGGSAAISGSTAVVGAWKDLNSTGHVSGAVYVWKRVGLGDWGTPTKLIASDGATDDHFGYSVAIAGDTIAVASWHDDDGGTDSGSVYVFEWNTTTEMWDETGKLTASDAAGFDNFGVSVAIRDDETKIVVGAWFDDDGGTNSGSVYVCERGTGWGNPQTCTNKISLGSPAAGDLFGRSVSISGRVIVAGSPQCFPDSRCDKSGQAFSFKWDGSIWNEQEISDITEPAQDGDRFGWDVGFDGTKAVVGARGDDDNISNSGSIFVFKRSGGDWVIDQKLYASDNAESDQLGNSVDVDVDAGVTTIVGGAQRHDHSGVTNTGGVCVFTAQ